MLKAGGIINIVIAVAHIIGLLWAEQMFEVTGIGNEMNELAQIHTTLPYLITVIVTVIFFIFGLYGLSADEKFRKLPFLKLGIFAIAGIYILRGFGELIYQNLFKDSFSIIETVYSLIALSIGFLFLFGGLKKWHVTKYNSK